jgi:tetratricopeptide (TPR) repeat protein
MWHSSAVANHKTVIDSLVTDLGKAGQDTNKVKLLNDIGGYLISDRNYAEALKYLFKGKNLSETLGYKNGSSVSLNRIGIAFLYQNNNSGALTYFSKALPLARQINDKKTAADIISNIGIIYVDKGEYDTALKNYMDALYLREEIKDTNGIITSKICIANIYYFQSKGELSLKLYLSLLSMKKIQTDKFIYAEVLNNTGLVYRQLKDYAKALYYFTSTLKIDQEIGDQQGIALGYTNIGSTYYEMGNYNIALEKVKEGLFILNSLDDKKNAAESYGEMGIIYDSLQQGEKALECYARQLKLSNEIGSKLNIKKACLFFSNHYGLVHNYKGAYDYFKLYKSMEDSIKSEASLKTMTELQTKYETENKEKEIELLKAGQKLQSVETKKQTQFVYSVFSLAIVMSLALFLLYNRRQLKNRGLLEKKNFELERKALDAQMDPHFIFNSLASISGFVAENNKEKAVEYLGIFSRLIRHNLEKSREQLVSVIEESEMLRSYLFLQQMRYNNAFTFTIRLDGAIDTSMAIPPMFIQPFVENAILHGMIPKEENGMIDITFYLSDAQHVVCEIRDNGIGKTESLNRKNNSSHKSLGMSITEERVQLINAMNKEKIQIFIDEPLNKDHVVTGTLVKIVFPADSL